MNQARVRVCACHGTTHIASVDNCRDPIKVEQLCRNWFHALIKNLIDSAQRRWAPARAISSNLHAVKSGFQLKSVTILGFVLETGQLYELLSKDDRRLRRRRLQLKAPNLLECGKQRVLWVSTHTHTVVLWFSVCVCVVSMGHTSHSKAAKTGFLRERDEIERRHGREQASERVRLRGAFCNHLHLRNAPAFNLHAGRVCFLR